MNVKLEAIFGSDLMVVNAARVSFGKRKTKLDAKDTKLIEYLVQHNHIAPFFHPKIQFTIQCPIYVERQITKTSVGVATNEDFDINSISGRYVDFSDSYTTITEWRKQSESSKQGSAGALEHQMYPSDIESEVIQFCKNAYYTLVNMGVSKEQARTILPLNLNTTFLWTGSLYAFIRLCQLRLKPDAQKETRDLVHMMLNEVRNAHEFDHSLYAFGLDDSSNI